LIFKFLTHPKKSLFTQPGFAIHLIEPGRKFAGELAAAIG
jgi:hypothetical protein